MPYLRKRGGHTLSKGRLLAAQFKGYLDDDHWRDNARHANAMAARLADGLAARGLHLAWERAGNEVFVIMKQRQAEALRGQGCAFHPWSATNLAPGHALGPDEGIYRLVTSFATQETMVDGFLALVGETL